MSAPPLRRDRLRWCYRGSHRRWWGHGRGNGAGHQHENHQPASHERQNEHPHHSPDSTLSPRWRAGHSRCISARLPALAGIRPVVNASAGDGSRRVRSALGILAQAEATATEGIPHTGLGQVEPEWSEFEALAKSPCHVPAILPCHSRAGGNGPRRSVGTHAWSYQTPGPSHRQAFPTSAETVRRVSTPPRPPSTSAGGFYLLLSTSSL